MELALIILVIGIVFLVNQPSIDKENLLKVIKTIDKELNKAFKKRDDKIEELENKIKRIEDTAVEKGLSDE